MHEFVISLSWEQLDRMTDWIDSRLTAWNTPTVLRMRVQIVLEELFSALILAQADSLPLLRCTFPDRSTLLLQYRSEAGPLYPDLSDLRALAERPSTYGLKLGFNDGSCTVLVGRK